MATTAEISKALKKVKDIMGISNIRQNYVGTGSSKGNRQLWVRFKNGAVIDLWLYEGSNFGRVEYGGVVTINKNGERVFPETRGTKITTVDETIKNIMADLADWAGYESPVTA